VTCTVTLRARASTAPLVTKRLPALKLPVSPAEWRAQFAKCFQGVHDEQESYDAALSCDVEFSADELGTMRLHIEREFAPIRWSVSREAQHFVVRLSNETSDAVPPRVGRIACETPDVEEALEPAAAVVAPPQGGLYVARKGDYLTAVVVAPSVKGLAALRCTPRLQGRPRSPGGVLMALRFVVLWGAARPSGSLLATARRHDVLGAFAEQIAALIGGDRWARAELAATTARGRDELQYQIAGGDERAFAAFVAAEQLRVAQLTLEQRVGLLADAAHRLLRLPELRTAAVPVGGGVLVQRRRDNPEHPYWLSELALRLASDPTKVLAWAGANIERGLKNLLDTPALYRGARFIVVAQPGGAAAGSGMTCLDAGWRWDETPHT
jgi:hypothetical protein